MNNPDPIAAAIHETWRALSAAQGWRMQPHLDRSYADLAEPDKEDNRAAARRMADVLSRARLTLSSDPAAVSVPPATIEAAIEVMAAAEHKGWMAHRAANGWTHAPVRNDAAKQHPSMIEYKDLAEAEKEKDRNNVRHYPEFAARAGLKIAPLA